MGLPSQPHVGWGPSHPITNAPPSATDEFCDLCGEPDQPDTDIRRATGFNVCKLCMPKFMEDELEALR